MGERITNDELDQRDMYYIGNIYFIIKFLNFFIEAGFVDCYMFRVGENAIIDATFWGNEARYLNHSCEPTCNSEPLDDKRVIMYAK